MKINNCPTRTVLHSGQSKVRQVRLNKIIAKILSSIGSETNKKYTQGIVAYEILMMSYEDYKDSMDELEDYVDDDLESLNVDTDIVNNYTESSGIKLKSSNRTKVRRIWLPLALKNKFDQIEDKLPDLIEESVINYLESPYRDRKHRIDVKKEIKKKIKYSNYSFDYEISETIFDDIKNKITIEDLDDLKQNKGFYQTWEERLQVYNQNIDCKFDTIEEVTKFFADLYDANNKSYVESKVRKYRQFGHSSNRTITQYDVKKARSIINNNHDKDLEDMDASEYIRALSKVRLEYYTERECIEILVREPEIAKEDTAYLKHVKVALEVLRLEDVSDNDVRELIKNSDLDTARTPKRNATLVIYN